jgi:hypothetical protein
MKGNSKAIVKRGRPAKSHKEIKSKVMTPEIQQPEEYSLIRIDPQALISRAIDKGVPIEQMERLLAMRRELEAEYAKKAYFEALANFQRQCPEIKKTKEVTNRKGELIYRYAPLESIVAQVKGLLEECGFSYVLKPRQTATEYVSICIAHHKEGHEEATEFSVPIGTEDYMTDVQKMGARNTYTRRYAFCNAFGIMTGDEDDDGKSTGHKEENKHEYEPRPPLGANTPIDVDPIPVVPPDIGKRIVALNKKLQGAGLKAFQTAISHSKNVGEQVKIVEKYEQLQQVSAEIDAGASRAFDLG